MKEEQKDLSQSISDEKQKEQKPINRPKFKIGDVVKFKGFGDEPADDTPLKIVGYDNELYLFDNGTTDLFSEQNLYELIEQKPVKHPKMVEMLREHLENTPKEQLDVEFEELKNWNDVGPTVEEFFHGKPIEWNEKDEKMRACAISLLQISRDSGMAINPGFGKPVRAINKCIDWLKFLRPSWKPSEEHFQALRRAIIKADKGSDAETWLIDLYEQLEKLM